MGEPSEKLHLVFNGDYVDRGAWGLETLLLLLAWKLAAPEEVTLLRGNHETALCTLVYGFKGELVAKLGRGRWKVRLVKLNGCGGGRAFVCVCGGRGECARYTRPQESASHSPAQRFLIQ